MRLLAALVAIGFSLCLVSGARSDDRPADSAPQVFVALPNAPCPASPDLCHEWRRFRQEQAVPYQAISVADVGASDWIVIISEYPPGVTGVELLDWAAKLFGQDLVESLRMRFPTGADGWLEDVVLRVRLQDADTLAVISGRTRTHWDAPAALVNRTQALYRLMHGDLIGYALDHIEAPISPSIAGTDLSVSPADIRDWAKAATPGWTPVFDGEGLPPSSPPNAVTWQRITSATKPITYENPDAHLVVLVIPAAANVSDTRRPFRAFSYASDVIVGAVKGVGARNATVILGRKRHMSPAYLPPLRFETFAVLAGNRETDLYQSYERQRIFAGRLDNGSHRGWDWAPIAMSAQIEDTDFGTLLNIADQILKSWSQAGHIDYVGFDDYKRPNRFPFGAAPASQVFSADLGSDSLVFNWNTDGYSTRVPVTGVGEIITAQRTAALPVLYIPSGGDVGTDPRMRQVADRVAAGHADTAYDYFNDITDPTLTRVAQYVILHQVSRSFLRDLRGAGTPRAMARTAGVQTVLRHEAESWIASALGERSGTSSVLRPETRRSLERLVAARGRTQVANFLTSADASGRAQAQLVREDRNLVSQIQARNAEYSEVFNRYCIVMVRNGGARTTAPDGTEQCGINVRAEQSRIDRINAEINPLDRQLRSIESATAVLKQQRDALDAKWNALQSALKDVDAIADDVVGAASFSSDTARILERVLSNAQLDVTKGAIRTPTIVVSRNSRDSGSVGGHNIGGTPVRVSVAPGTLRQVAGQGGEAGLRIPETSLSDANRLGGLVGRGRQLSDSAEAPVAARSREQALGLTDARPERRGTLLESVRASSTQSTSPAQTSRLLEQAGQCDGCPAVIMRLPEGGYLVQASSIGSTSRFVASDVELVQLLSFLPNRQKIGFLDIGADSARALVESADLLGMRGGAAPAGARVEWPAMQRLFNGGRNPPPQGPTFVEVSGEPPMGSGAGRGGERRTLTIADDLSPNKSSALRSQPAWADPGTSVKVHVEPNEISDILARYGHQRNPSLPTRPVVADISLVSADPALKIESVAILAELPPARVSTSAFEGIILSERLTLASQQATLSVGLSRIRARLISELNAQDFLFFVKTNKGDLQGADAERFLRDHFMTSSASRAG